MNCFHWNVQDFLDDVGLECRFLKLGGAKLESQGPSPLVDALIAEVQHLSTSGKHSSIRFCLLELIDLRATNWIPPQKQNLAQLQIGIQSPLQR